MHHLQGQSLIRVNGSEAGSETYFMAVIQATAEDGTLYCSQLGGRYVDKLVKEHGKWRIKERTAIRDWSATHKVVEDGIAAEQLKGGHRDAQDPSYAVLKMRFGAPI